MLKEALQTSPYHWFILVKLAIATGMRRGELLGLEWDSINLKTGVVEINKIISKTRDGRHEIKPPKYNSIRFIHLPSSIIKELKKYKSYCKREKVKLQDKWKETEFDWVFYNE